MDEKDIKFIARHYRKGAFSVESAWRQLGIAGHSWWTRARIAAAISILVVVGATAGIIINDINTTPEKPATVQTETTSTDTRKIVRSIDFENAPLSKVADSIEEVYGVKIAGIPEDADRHELSLRYEGNVEDLVKTINELFGTELTILE